MYTPRHFAMSDDRARELLASASTAQLVTAHEDGPAATLLPFMWRPDATGASWGSLIFHVTRVNPVSKRSFLGDALAIVSGPDGYVDADWHPSNAENPGVPTWNYITLHAYGPLVIHDDADWVRAAVGELSAAHGYDDGRVDVASHDRMLRAIVGIELLVRRIEAKEKLSQNRSPADVGGVIDGLRGVGGVALADAMADVSMPHAVARAQLIAEIGDKNRTRP